MLRPLGNAILFTFNDDCAQGKFIPVSASGILLTNQNAEANSGPKWGKVLAVGSRVIPDIEVGMYILVDALKWTIGLEYEGVKIWKTDDKQIIATSDEMITYY